MRARLTGVNTVRCRLAGGKVAVYYYHRATGTRLSGEPGSPEFLASLAEAAKNAQTKPTHTLSDLVRAFEKSSKWRRLGANTQKEYRRVFKLLDERYGTVPYAALEDKEFRKDVLEWHDEIAQETPREADNRVAILARVLSWGNDRGYLRCHVLQKFERAYSSDRSEIIWLPEHVAAFVAAASPMMRLALMLGLHTGQRQSDILRLRWSDYDGQWITLRQGKTSARLAIPCTAALRATLDATERRGPTILTATRGGPFKKRYFAQRWAEACEKAEIKELHFHDLRGTAVTMLAEAGCTVPEISAITGHSIRSVHEILEKYLARTRELAANAIAKLEAKALSKTPCKTEEVH